MRRAFVLSLCTLGALAPPAAAGWSGSAQNLGAMSGRSFEPVALAGNARGHRVIAWEAPRGIATASARPGQRFGRPRMIAGSKGGFEPVADIDERGRAVIAWSYDDGTRPMDPEDRVDEGCCVGLKLVLRTPHGRLKRARRLTPPGHIVIERVLDIDGGRVAVLWRDAVETPRDQLLMLRFFGRGRPPSGPVTIRRNGAVHLVSVRRGRAQAVFSRSASGEDWYEVAVSPDGTRGRSRRVGRIPFSGADVVTNRRGGQLALYQRSGSGVTKLVLATRRPGGRFRTRTLARTARRGDEFSFVSLAVAGSGLAMAAWAERGRRIGTVLARAGGKVMRRRLYRPRSAAFASIDHAAVNSRAQSALLWGGETRRGTSYVFGALGSALGSFGDLRTFAVRRRRFDAEAHGAAIDDRGLVSAAFSRAGRLKVAWGDAP